MIEDILSLPEVATIEGKEYKLQFDCKTYAILESMTGKSIFKIQDLLADNNLFLIDSITLIACALMKNHTEEEVKTVREIIENKPSIISTINYPICKAFFKGIAPPEIFKKVEELQNKLTKIVEEPKKKVKSKKKV